MALGYPDFLASMGVRQQWSKTNFGRLDHCRFVSFWIYNSIAFHTIEILFTQVHS